MNEDILDFREDDSMAHRTIGLTLYVRFRSKCHKAVILIVFKRKSLEETASHARTALGASAPHLAAARGAAWRRGAAIGIAPPPADAASAENAQHPHD